MSPNILAPILKWDFIPYITFFYRYVCECNYHKNCSLVKIALSIWSKASIPILDLTFVHTLNIYFLFLQDIFWGNVCYLVLSDNKFFLIKYSLWSITICLLLLNYKIMQFFLFLKGTKLWIIMEYLGGGSALDLVSSHKYWQCHLNESNLVQEVCIMLCTQKNKVEIMNAFLMQQKQ